MVWRGAAALGALIAGACLTSCGVPPGSAVAVGVTASGQPVGYMLACDGTVDTATLRDGKSGARYGEWTIESLGPGAFTSFTLGAPGNGWKAGDPAFINLKPGVGYEFRAYGGQNDHSGDGWSSTYVDFTLSQLSRLAPDQVRYWAGSSDDGNHDRFETITIDEFKARACQPLTGRK